MRPIERIDNFLEKVDWGKLEERWGISPLSSKLHLCHLDKDKLAIAWKEVPDQRFGQFLINSGFIENGDAWNDEEPKILEAQGLPPEDYVFWTSHLDEDGMELDEPITRLVANLDPEHIVNIKNYFGERELFLPGIFVEAFDNVLAKHALKEVA